jgi:hypothetical protein
MSDLRTAAQQALEALNWYAECAMVSDKAADAASALRAALEQPEQPVAWLESPYGSIRMNTTMRFQFPPQSLKWKIPLFTHPPRREWRGLDDSERAAVQHESFKRGLSPLEFMELHEAKLKELNHE